MKISISILQACNSWYRYLNTTLGPLHLNIIIVPSDLDRAYLNLS
jgi:hypothetical protein